MRVSTLLSQLCICFCVLYVCQWDVTVFAENNPSELHLGHPYDSHDSIPPVETLTEPRDVVITPQVHGEAGYFYTLFGSDFTPLASFKKWWSGIQDWRGVLETVDNSSKYNGVIHECSLVDSFGWWVQTLGGVLASSVLLIKWRFESPRRPTYVWFLDSVKNGSSQLTAHFLSVQIAELASSSVSSSVGVSPCSWYLWVFILDITIGVLLAYVFLKVWEAALRHNPVCGRSGDYGQEWDSVSGLQLKQPQLTIFYKQLLVWIMQCVIPSRIVCGSLVALFAEQQLKPATIVSDLFRGHPRAELLFVLLIGPVFMNAIQFLIQDAFLLAKPHSTGKKAVMDAFQLHTAPKRAYYKAQQINYTKQALHQSDEDNDDETMPMLHIT